MFQAYTEPDPGANQTCHYQSLCFQEPYKKKSFEELRVEHYAQFKVQSSLH
jgi:nuclear pore complex protein Nup98-Nup96